MTTPELNTPESDHQTGVPLVPVGRLVVYLVVAAAVLVVIWALIEGGDRDLWSPPGALVAAQLSAALVR